MDAKMFARLAAVAFVALAITATVIDMTRKEQAPVEANVPVTIAPTSDPLREEMIRCRLLGEAGERDAACLRAWAENRNRFLMPGSRPEARMPDPMPAVTSTPPEAR